MRTLDLRATMPTAAEAERRAEAWLRERQATTGGEVLVITGRGRGSVDGIAVVRRAVERLLARTRAWTFGNPADPAVDMGTVIDAAAAAAFEGKVNAAVGEGATLLFGNERDGALYSPTVLDRVLPGMDVVRTETFGPVSPVIRFRDIDDAIRISNSTAYGLSSAVCTNRLDYVTRFVAELQVGTVNVREVPGYRLELTPFGGVKDSGLGYKEGVQEAMKSFTNVKTYSLPW